MDLSTTKLKEICRACIKQPGNVKYNLTSSLNMTEKFVLCTSLNVDKEDGFPNYLCQACFTKLEEFFEFREMCIISMKTLTDIIEIKKEEENFEEHSESSDDNSLTFIKVKETDEAGKDDYFDNDKSQILSEIKNERVSPSISDVVETNKTETITLKAIHTCTICNKIFYKAMRYQAHLREHEGLKPFVCQKCGREYSKSSGLLTHIKRKHSRRPNTDIHICPFEGCEKTYKTKETLRIHYKKFHTPNYDEKKNSVICELCGKTLSTNGALKRHRFTHTGELPFKCEQCGKRYVSRDKLREHSLRHKGIKNFICPHCGLRKTTKHELNVHINYHTKEKVHTCEHCSSSFTNIGNLTRHIKVVHKGIKKFLCKFCDKSFGKAETLKHHEMTHTGERPHECEKCGKRFIQLVALQVHLKRHAKKKKNCK